MSKVSESLTSATSHSLRCPVSVQMYSSDYSLLHPGIRGLQLSHAAAPATAFGGSQSEIQTMLLFPNFQVKWEEKQSLG